MAGTCEALPAVGAGALVEGRRRREGALIGSPWQFVAAPHDRGAPPRGTARAFGEKKPELLQARVESTMEAVEETNGAKSLSLRLKFSAELCCAAIFFVNELELCL
jgi:hypothetical protein